MNVFQLRNHQLSLLGLWAFGKHKDGHSVDEKLKALFLGWSYLLNLLLQLEWFDFCCSAGGVPSNAKLHSNISDFTLQIFKKKNRVYSIKFNYVLKTSEIYTKIVKFFLLIMQVLNITMLKKSITVSLIKKIWLLCCNVLHTC